MRTVVVDLETGNFRSDIGVLTIACFGELDSNGKIKSIQTRTIQDIGRGTVAQRERMLALWTVEQWQAADIVIGQNHQGFDKTFLQGVMLRHGIQDGILAKRIMIDTYQTGKGRFGMSMSMANLVDVLGLGAKDAPHKKDWRESNAGDPASLERIKERCISDVKLTALMWAKLKPTYMIRFGK